MPRVKLQLPERWLFSTECQVPVAMVNYGGHLGHDAVITLAHEARLQFFQSLGYEHEANIEGAGAFLADLAVIYKSEGFHGQRIRIDIGVGEISRAGFEMFHKLYNCSTERDLAYLRAGVVMVDPSSRKPITVPSSLRNQLEAP